MKVISIQPASFQENMGVVEYEPSLFLEALQPVCERACTFSFSPIEAIPEI